MTKRAFQKFPRAADDFYPTPQEAVQPLFPFLWKIENSLDFAEPCLGDGSLAVHLEMLGLNCVASGDINDANKLDARHWVREHYGKAKFVVTNPPWEAKLMAQIMDHQSQWLPSWFLVYSDWLFTHQSSLLIKERCTDIVPIGRLKWIKGSKSVGFDNCAWVRMWVDKKVGHSPAKFWPIRP